MDSPIQRFQFLNKYAREGERTWSAATRRVEKYMRRQCPAIDEGTWAFVNKHVANRGATWAMRVLQMAGPATEKCQVGLYNCAYVPVESLRDFTDALYILMQGTGVGFSVENVDALPAVLPPGDSARLTWTVEDSTEGWVAALRAGLSAWWNGMDLSFDYSAIRPAGAPLRTKGGRASGPEPLRELLDFARDVVRGAAGRKLTSLEVHRIFCKIGRIVEVGGVRRAAMLSLSRLDDDEMRHAKDGSFWEEFPELTMANNSAVYEERPSRDVWEREWAALRASGTGERGVFNRGSRRKRERKGTGKVGTNPCVAGDTWIATAEGPRQVRDLLEGPFTAIVGGKPYHATPFWKTGEKEVFRVHTREGYTLRATANHEVYTSRGKVPVEELAPDDVILVDHAGIADEWSGVGAEAEGWLLGNLYGDGALSDNHAYLAYWGGNKEKMLAHAAEMLKRADVPHRADCGSSSSTNGPARLSSARLVDLARSFGMTKERKAPDPSLVEKASRAFYVGFLSGWFDADGCIQGTQDKGYSARLCCVERSMLEMAQRMLARLGMYSRIYKRKDAGFSRLPDGRGGSKLYPTQVVYDLVVSARSLNVFMDVMRLSNDKHLSWVSEIRDRGWTSYRDKSMARVTSVVPDGLEEVYDCTVEEVHRYSANGLLVSNCGEIKRERKGVGKVGTNPCVAGDTWIATAEGPRQVRDLLEGPFTAIVGGKPYHATPFWKTGEKEVFRVHTREGYTLRATIDHRVYTTKGKVPVGSLDPGDQIIVDYEDYPDEHATVVSVVPDGIEEVYDCTVEEVHRYSANGLLVSNCGEIVLFPRQFCNLSIAVVRPGDTFADLAEKVRAAAIMGTIQSACTRFSPVIDRRWKEQTERERLLGVDLLGATDVPISRDDLAALRKIVVDTNREYAAILGIPPATAATCIKPGGNSSVLLGTGNSVTGWFAEYYLRRVRVNKVDPMFAFLAESGVPWDEEYHDPRIAVFAFPCRAEGPVLRDGAIARLEWWRELQVHWAEHSVSATIYVRDGEWDAVRDWVWEHWDDVTGLTFLPADDSVYPLAPLEEITAEEYAAAVERFPDVDWEAFSPSGDGTRELVCTAGACTWG